MSTEQPSQGAALAEWFDDTTASEEVQALRAWVAGLSGELAQARQDRDEAQRALQAALAELDRLRAELAEVAVRRAEAAQAEVGAAERPAAVAEAGAAPPAAPAVDAGGAPGPLPDRLPSEAPQATLPTDLTAARRSRADQASDEITVEVLEAWAATPAVLARSAPETPAQQPAPEASPAAGTPGGPADRQSTSAAVPAAPLQGWERSAPERPTRAGVEPAEVEHPDAQPMATNGGSIPEPALDEDVDADEARGRTRRIRLLAATLVVLAAAALVVVIHGPRLLP